MEILKVSAKTEPAKAAGALAAVIRRDDKAEVHAIGAPAVNQAVKAITIARGYVAPSGIDLVMIPGFTDTVIDGEEKTAMKFSIERR